jgi:hypothetical protein
MGAARRWHRSAVEGRRPAARCWPTRLARRRRAPAQGDRAQTARQPDTSVMHAFKSTRTHSPGLTRAQPTIQYPRGYLGLATRAKSRHNLLTNSSKTNSRTWPRQAVFPLEILL